MCFIQKYNTFQIESNFGFNFTKGGEGRKGMAPWNKGKIDVYSDEVINKMRESKKGKKNPMYGKHHRDDVKDRISKSISKNNNTSGYFRVYKVKNKKTKNGFEWKYVYYEHRKQKAITSVDIKKLEKKVKQKGLEWIKYEV